MKHPYTFPALALSVMMAGSASAQLVALTDTDGNALNGTTINVSGGDDSVLEYDIITTSPTDQWVNLRRYESDVQPGTQNYFCWYQCYLPVNAGVHPVWTSSDPVNLSAGEPFNGAHAYYDPSGVVGTSTFRYVWFSTSDPNDSTWVDIVFNAQAVGISEVAAPVRAFTAYPNPSVGGDITLDYDLASADAGTRLTIYNMLGERKLVRNIAAAQGRVVLHESDLGSGVWFATLERNGHALAMKRLVIAR